jgi:phosphotransferase system enzyme I (PtsI)
MVPLVTCVDEIRGVKALVKEISQQLDAEGIPYNKDIEVGVMIETPAASLIADILAKEADFFSIGTNDLTQYTMAVDRGNADVAYLYSAYNPAVLRSMKFIIESANKEGIMVGMCGEAAADPLLIPLLISFGLKEFSVSATSILETRKNISMWSKEEADQLAQKALELATESEVAELLRGKCS